MARANEGLTEQLGPRITPEELQFLVEISKYLGKISNNRGLRYAIRYAHQHATSTTDHTKCLPHSPCAAALRGLDPAAARTGPALPGQTSLTHEATMEDK